MSDIKVGDEVVRPKVTAKDLASNLGILVTMRHPWTARPVRACWLLLGVGSEREVALRWRKPRYRLMISTPKGETVEWFRYINGKKIPICTRRAGDEREADFLRLHPDCTARLERVARMFSATEEGADR